MAQRKPEPSRRQGDDDDDGPGGAGGSLRIDKWLWCARFFKTRGLAQEAVDGGHVQLNGDRIKASRQVKPGDRLQVTRDRERFVLDVVSIPARRGPAAEARRHYLETPESEAARAAVREFNRLSGPVSTGRPDKRERRDLMRIVKGRGGLSDDDDPA
ncbi:MAG: RNA-binding S4 domain-containing protein [Steroidobacteraceae bacterium]